MNQVEQKPLEDLVGFLESIVFSSEETGFTVARLNAPHSMDLITIVGTLPGVQPGERLSCRGTWKHHSQYGRQFEIQDYSLKAPADEVGIEKYLASGLIKGIGPVYAKRIVKTFGTDTLDVIDQEAEKLLKIEGLGEKRIQKIADCWEEQKSIRKVMIFLQSHQVKISFAYKIFKKYGDASIQKVQENPYLLAKEIHGIGFKTADEIAKNLGIEATSPLRVQAGIEHALWELSSNGNTCYPKKELMLEASKMLDVDHALIEKGAFVLEEERHIIHKEMEGISYIWVAALYASERGIANELKRLYEAPSSIRSIDQVKAIDWAEKSLAMKFADGQKEAIGKSFSSSVLVITGGPGTGKSTITKAILLITGRLTDKIILAAPTGRAAKRMTEITGRKAFTIHSLLEFDFKKGGFKKNRKTPLGAKLFIVDEASMIDTQLMYAFLQAVPTGSRILLIGDIDQLPSVGPGSVLKDIIASNQIPIKSLDHIFRQGKGSKIVTNAHKINKGFFPDIEQEKGSDFVFFPIDEPEDIIVKAIELIEKHIPQRTGLHPINDVQVLCPMRRGVIGADNFNHVLQQRLNPQDLSISRMGREFNLNDKVMQIRNNYDKNVFNGDIGRVTHIDHQEQEIEICFDENHIIYNFNEIDELVLAYAVSIHKYQGSECPCIMIPVHTSHYRMLFRNLLYTGVTRGKKLVILLGTKKALFIAVKTDHAQTRHTGLKNLILDFMNVFLPLEAQ